MIVDAKYYSQALSKRFGKEKLRSRHLYQILAYLRNREANEASGPKHEGMLLYPTVDEEIAVDVRLEGFAIKARSINLAQNWKNIHKDLLGLVV